MAFACTVKKQPQNEDGELPSDPQVFREFVPREQTTPVNIRENRSILNHHKHNSNSFTIAINHFVITSQTVSIIRLLHGVS